MDTHRPRACRLIRTRPRKALALGTWIDFTSGRHLIYQLVVNNIPISQLDELLQVFQDEGTISAMLWRDN